MINERIDKIIGSSWMSELIRVERGIGYSSIAKEIESISSGLNLTKTARIASQVLHEPEIVRIAKSVAQQSHFLKYSDVINEIFKLSESDKLAKFALQAQTSMVGYRGFFEPNKIASSAISSSRFYEKFNSSYVQSILQSPSFEALIELNKLQSGLDIFDDPEFIYNEFEDLDDSVIEVDEEIRNEVMSQKDFSLLSEKSKKLLLYLYHTYFLPIFLTLLTNYCVENAAEARKELDRLSTPAEVRSFTRSSNKKFDRQALKGYRVTTVNDLNLRVLPGIKSEIVVMLPIGTLVEVIDKSNRSWLFVEVEIDGVSERGWVSRRYTASFK